jgi:predicted HicB family RNase H-like nuclease
MKKMKTLKIDEYLHSKLKKYAKEKTLKLNEWVENIIRKEFEKIISNDDNK